MDPATRAFIDESTKSFVTILCTPMFMMLAACAAGVTLMAFSNPTILARDRSG